MKALKSVFESEAALCAAFIAQLPKDWTAYPETAGFDILLVRGADGAQIGVEAKMTLNAKVLMQAVEGLYSGRGSEGAAPDFRAALVPGGTAGAEMKCLARYLGIAVIEMTSEAAREEEGKAFAERYGVSYRRAHTKDKPWFTPELPVQSGYVWRDVWTDHCPAERCKVPAYVPDVVAGASGPSQLSEWKIEAIKICILLERHGFVTIADFKKVGIDRKRWLDMWWIAQTEERGRYVAGRKPLDLRVAHPVNYGQIEADFEKWKPSAAEFKAALAPMPALL